jgi:phage/plasmid-like protein (TIGR03299 family)
MAHNLHINSAGQASMMYVGETPWHKLGKKLDKPATAEEAIHAAGLDYTVQKKPLKAIINGKCHVPVADHYATVRLDTNQILGVVGSRYEAIQNRDAFSFFDAIVDHGEAIYHTAGALGNGERIWILAQLPGYIKIGKDDIINKYLLLTNSHDGSSLVRAKLTPIRVVCNNTLSAALKGSEQEARIRHTANAVVKLEQAHKILGLTNDLYTQLDYIFNRMQLKRITDKQLLDYVKALVPDNPIADSNIRTENIRSTILDLHQSGQGASMCRGSLWGAYNALTEYTDHVQNSKDTSKQLNSVWFGSGEQLKRRAYQLAESML